MPETPIITCVPFEEDDILQWGERVFDRLENIVIRTLVDMDVKERIHGIQSLYEPNNLVGKFISTNNVTNLHLSPEFSDSKTIASVMPRSVSTLRRAL